MNVKKQNMARLLRCHNGQSAIEYLLLFAIVIATFFVFLRPGGKFSGIVSDSLNQSVEFLEQNIDDVDYTTP